MPNPSPRHLARPRRPWRLLLVAFGLTLAVLAALVASATLVPPQSPPRNPAPGVAQPTVTVAPAPTFTSLTSSTTTEPSTASQPTTMAGRPTGADAPVPSGTTATSRRSALGPAGATTQPSVTTL